jgi:hypothetical protein
MVTDRVIPLGRGTGGGGPGHGNGCGNGCGSGPDAGTAGGNTGGGASTIRQRIIGSDWRQSGSAPRIVGPPLLTIPEVSCACSSLLDHPGCRGQQRFRDGEAERLGGF